MSIFKVGDRVTINVKTMSSNACDKFLPILEKNGGYLIVHSIYDTRTGSINFDESLYGRGIGGSQGWIADRFLPYTPQTLFKNEDFIL